MHVCHMSATTMHQLLYKQPRDAVPNMHHVAYCTVSLSFGAKSERLSCQAHTGPT